MPNRIIEIKRDEKAPLPKPKTVAEKLADFEALVESYKTQNPVKYADKEKRGEFDRERALIKGERPKPLKMTNPPQEPREEIKGELDKPKKTVRKETKAVKKIERKNKHNEKKDK